MRELLLPDVIVSEVGPRDGLQSLREVVMPTEWKRRWIDALADAGLREIEVGSFVPPKLLPQMADTAEIVAHTRATRPDVRVVALAPNLKGAERAFAAGVSAVTLPVSASHAHSLANVRKTPDEAVAEVAAVVRRRDELTATNRPKIEAGIATAFGCTIQGVVEEREVLRLAVALAEAGVDSVGLSDTAGYANPAQVRRLFKALRAEIGDRAGAAHFHNTLGLGLANAVAALEEGVRTLDSSLGGLGGCPWAPGATGNIVTEDLVFMLEAMGLRTGINLEKLSAIREIVREGLGGKVELYGYLTAVGLPKNYVPPSPLLARAS